MTTQRWPTAWLMTDERMGDRLWPAIDCAADVGAGIIFRPYATDPERRAEVGRHIADMAQRRGLVLGVGGDAVLARALGARLVHNPRETTLGLPFSRSVHNEYEAAAAKTDGASLVFVSPVYPTRSHPGAAALGEKEAARLAMLAGVPAFALGGVDPSRQNRLRKLGFAGWAGIDAWVQLAERRSGSKNERPSQNRIP
jgi:thiamine-phosphate pyrophosphorylase